MNTCAIFNNIETIPYKRDSLGSICKVIVILCSILLLPYSQINAESITYTVKTDLSTFTETTETAPDGTNFSKLYLESCTNEGEIGAGEVLTKSIRFAVPKYSNNFKISVKNKRISTSKSLSFDLFPVQEPIPASADLSSDLFTYPDKNQYINKSDINASITGESFYDGWIHTVTVSVPVMKIVSSKQIELFGEIELLLSYDLCSASQISFTPLPGRPVHSNAIIEDIVVNPNDFDYSKAEKSSVLRGAYNTEKQYYYIIVPEDLKNATTALAQWKRQKGYEVVVTTIESILSHPSHKVGATAEIVDNAASLRHYLRTQRDIILDKFYVLLIGDYRTSMPIRKATDGTVSNISSLQNPNGPAFIPTDNYFADLTTNINLHKYTFDNNTQLYCYDCQRIEYSSDIYIGRLLCSKNEEIQNYTRKLIIYESNPGFGNNDYLSRATGFMHYDMNTTTSKKVFSLFNDSGYYNNHEILIEKDSYIMGSDVINLMKKCGFSSWHGHGNPGSILTSRGEPYFDNNNREQYNIQVGCYITALDKYDRAETDLTNYPNDGLDNLDNNGYPFVAYSISCTIMPFDKFKYDDKLDDKNNIVTKKREFDIPYNMGSAFTVAGSFGGVALISNTRDGLIVSSTELETHFVESIIKNKTIGIAVDNSKKAYQFDNYVVTTNNLVGDPEFEMWLEKPKLLDDIQLKFTGDILNLTGTELSGCSLSVFDGDNNKPINNMILSSSSESINLPIYDITPGISLVSIRKTGSLPKIVLACQNKEVSNFNKEYYVCDALIGALDNSKGASSFIVGDNASLTVNAIHSIKTTDNFSIGNNGIVNLNCDGIINLSGLVVKSGGTLNATGEKVILGPGFKVEPGGKINIRYKN